MQTIYLDYNSTTPIDPRVAKVMTAAYLEGYVNPASQHRMGQRARTKLEQLRSRISESLGGQAKGMQTDQLVFTSGGTEANNLALIGLARQSRDDSDGEKNAVLISAVEHPSLFGARDSLSREGFKALTIPVDQQGVIDLLALEQLIDQYQVAVVSIMLANNETGVIQPVQQAAKLCRDRNVRVHCDAVQVVGKFPVNFRDLGVDAMSFTAHKFHGPRGIGGLLILHGVTVQPILYGGFQQMAVRPGTEDVSLVAGLNEALLLYEYSMDRAKTMAKLRDRLQSRLCDEIPGTTINGGQVDRMPHTLNLSFPGIDRQAFLMAADLAGLAISTGSACASGSSEPSPVLLAMNASEDVVRGSVRISLGFTTTGEEIDLAIDRILTIVRNLAETSA